MVDLMLSSGGCRCSIDEGVDVAVMGWRKRHCMRCLSRWKWSPAVDEQGDRI